MKRVIIGAAAVLVLIAGGLGGFAWYVYYSGGSEIPSDLLIEVALLPPSEQELDAALNRWLPDRPVADNGGAPVQNEGPTGEQSPPVKMGVAPRGAGAESKPVVTEESIARQYLPRFLHLERRVNASLERVLQSGLEDYRVLDESASGGGREMAAKYLKTIGLLEKAADQEFDGLLSQMRGDLRAAGLPTRMVELARQEYKDRKKERRGILVEKARQRL